MSKTLCQTGPDSRKQGHARGFLEKGQKRPKYLKTWMQM